MQSGETKVIKIGLMGLGTVGSGVFKILTDRRAELSRVGVAIDVKAILVRDIEKKRLVDVDRRLLTTDPESILNDPEIEIVVELLGGTDPARNLILGALERGKHVVTANKEVMARYGEELWDAAERRSLDLYFEASVGGGIPIVRPLKEFLLGNRILKIMGIVNGTTNFVLTKMAQEKQEFKDALEVAKQLGYAESDPTADVDGLDAAAKIAILASIAFNSRVTVDQVYAEGISAITKEDIAYAEELGYVIKLVALAKDLGEKIEVRVHPTMLPVSHPLASVNDVYNAIFVEGDAVGELMFFGQGAGQMATASAVVGDLVEVARNSVYGSHGKISCTCYEKKAVQAIEDTVTCYYLLVEVADRPGVLASIAVRFGDNGVSIDKVIQKRAYAGRGGSDHPRAEVMFMTHATAERQLRAALAEIESLEVVERIVNLIRVEDPKMGH